MGQTQDGLDPFAVLARLEDAADSAPEFLFDALQFLGRYFNSPFAVLYQRLATTEVDEEFHSGPTNPAFWRPALREFLNDGLSSSEPRARVLAGEGAGLRIALISAALRDEGGEPNGRVALVIKLDDQSANELALVLEGYAALISRIAGQWKIRSTPEANRESSHKALSNAASAENAIELAFQLTNTLRTKLDCARVSLGMVHGARVNVISVSGFDEVKLRSPGCCRFMQQWKSASTRGNRSGSTRIVRPAACSTVCIRLGVLHSETLPWPHCHYDMKGESQRSCACSVMKGDPSRLRNFGGFKRQPSRTSAPCCWCTKPNAACGVTEPTVLLTG
jgi:hypothetical protein